jgi:hypothetical protein
MDSPAKLYEFGGITLSVKPIGGGAQEVTASNLNGSFDAEGTYHITSGSVEPAVSLLFKLIKSAFKADIFESTSGEDTVFRVVPPSDHAMRIGKKPADPAATSAMVDRIIEVKSLGQGKSSLSDEEFNDFLETVSARFPNKDSAAAAYKQTLRHEELQRRMIERAKSDRRDAAEEMKGYKASIEEVRHLLRPVVFTLAKHGIGVGDDFSQEIIYALLEGHSKATPEQRKDVSYLTNKYVELLQGKMTQLAIDADDDKTLLSDLRINIGNAETQHRSRAA